MSAKLLLFLATLLFFTTAALCTFGKCFRRLAAMPFLVQLVLNSLHFSSHLLCNVIPIFDFGSSRSIGQTGLQNFKSNAKPCRRCSQSDRLDGPSGRALEGRLAHADLTTLEDLDSDYVLRQTSLLVAKIYYITRPWTLQHRVISYRPMIKILHHLSKLDCFSSLTSADASRRHLTHLEVSVI